MLNALLVSLLLTSVFALLLVLFLRRPLHGLLVELCGNEPRARFWSAYWGATLVLAALFGLLASAPLGQEEAWGDSQAVPLVLSGLRASLFAVLLVLGMLALVLVRSIASYERGRSRAHFGLRSEGAPSS
ncbi:MAG TPA: hypothetical protein VF530_15805 [Planctomycetota bacterium]